MAKSLAMQSSKTLGQQKLNDFSDDFDKIITEYKNKYMFYSTAIKLQKLESCHRLVSNIIKYKDLLTPIIVDKMVNEKDLYSLSLYQNFYVGTDLIPNIDEYRSQY
ncbi:MAG: hypothetical protein WCP46_09645, partial [Alphaproteobacteria bacterium]